MSSDTAVGRELIVRLGARVLYRDEADAGIEEVTIVPHDEADAIRGRISAESPLARALLGRQTGECVSVRTPGGVRILSVLSVAAPPVPVG